MKPHGGGKFTIDEHRGVHESLHAALDELIADYFAHQPIRRRKSLSNTTLFELMKWSHEQTIKPTEPAVRHRAK